LIERATRQTIEPLSLPSVDDVNSRRLAKFKARIGEALAGKPPEFYRKAVQEVALETGTDLLDVAAAIATMVEGGAPIQSSWRENAGDIPPERPERPERAERARRREEEAPDLPAVAEGGFTFEDNGEQITYRLAVGNRHGAQPGSIVGAIANEAKLHGSQINGVDIRADYTLVRLPANLPGPVLARLSKVRIRGQELDLQASNMPVAKAKPGHRKGPPKR
jgi:ATP-dependent RNA helicase DeaD